MKTKNESTTDLCDLLQPLSDLSEYLGGKEIIPGILHALDAFAESEYQLKRYRKARMLQATNADEFYSLAMAYNAVGLRRLKRGANDWGKVVESYLQYKSNAADPVALDQWDAIVTGEIIPDVRKRLMDNGMSSGEMLIVTDPNNNLCDPNSWSQEVILNDLNRMPELLKLLETERAALPGLDRNKLADGVSDTKKYIIEIVKILVKVAIEVCKSWKKIISKIVELVWKWVEKWVEQKVLERCRDGKPIPVAAARRR
jgi:hypothetical protein